MSRVDLDSLMSLLVITVTEKRIILPNKTHSIYILYTPYRKRIYKITSSTYKNFPYNIGDDIQSVIDWCNEQKHEYRKRTNKNTIWDE